MLRALLTNIQTIAKHHRPVNPSKSPFFDQKWSKNAAFNKNTERAKYETLEVSERDHTAQINDQILVKHKTPMNAERSQFLNRITQDSVNFIAEQRALRVKAAREETLCQASMTALMEHMFEILKAYAYELNNAVAFSPLHMAATNPKVVTEVVKYDKLRNPIESVTLTRARLSTSRFSLILRGDKRGIEFYVLPVSRAIGLSKQEVHYRPIVVFKAILEGGKVYWETCDGKPLGAYHVEMVCMEAFHHLVEQTKRQVRAEEEADEIAARRIG